MWASPSRGSHRLHRRHPESMVSFLIPERLDAFDRTLADVPMQHPHLRSRASGWTIGKKRPSSFVSPLWP